MRIGICEWTTFPVSFDEELAAYRDAGAGAGVHVADQREPHRSDFDRLLPGEGSCAAVRALEAAGDGCMKSS